MFRKAFARSVFAAVAICATTSSFADVRAAEKEGTKDGKKYAQDLRSRGVAVDGTACAVGLAAMDSAKPHYSQSEIEAYAKAFGNTCAGRKIF